jgi:hypothetical protein
MRRTLDELLAAPGLTRGRFYALALVSVLATAVVMAAGVRHDHTPWQLLAAAHGRPAPVVEVTPAPAPAPAVPAVSGGASADASSGGGGAHSQSVPAAPPPVDTTQVTTPATRSPAPAPTTTAPAPAPAKPVSKVKHVFVLDVAASPPDATASYLNDTLRPQGRLLEGYKPLVDGDLATGIALVSGQQPTPGIKQGCPSYGADCVFGVDTLTLPDQLLAKGLHWRGYFDGMTQPCQHPDQNASEDPNADYTTVHNPFVYFRSLTDLGECATNDVPLDSLTADLADLKTTPNFVFVAAAKSAAPDQFLADWVPKILDSAAYKADGLVIVLARGQSGALLISRFAQRGTSSQTSYDAYGLLRSVEDLFGLDNLGAAGGDTVPSFAKTELAAGL